LKTFSSYTLIKIRGTQLHIVVQIFGVPQGITNE
jgi:hypothetical protein